MKKNYILDTNVLLHDPAALFSFQENNVYLPIEIITELDQFKKGTGEINVNARETGRKLDALTENGIPKEGIELGNGGKLFFIYSDKISTSAPGAPFKSPDNKSLEEMVAITLQRGVRILENRFGYADDRIIDMAKALAENDPQTPTYLIAKDINIRIRARLFGVQASDWLHDKAALDLNAFFQHETEIKVNPEIIDYLYQKENRGIMPLPENFPVELKENDYIALRCDSQSALVKYRKGNLIRLPERRAVEDIKPRNVAQRFFLDACLDPELMIVAGLGMAGTGKTLLAVAAGLHLVMDKSKESPFKKVIVFRPILEAGKDLGYLPGNVDEKINPYFRPIKAALEKIFGDPEYHTVNDRLQELLEFRPINFEKGDTLDNCYIIIDEAEDYSRKELKLLGTRMGENSKIVMVGDPFQLDNPYLDERSNGLTVTIDKMRGKVPEFAYVILDKVERSKGAEIFTKYL